MRSMPSGGSCDNHVMNVFIARGHNDNHNHDVVDLPCCLAVFAPLVGAGIVHEMFRGTVCHGALALWRCGVRVETPRANDGTSNMPQVGFEGRKAGHEFRRLLVVGSPRAGCGRRAFESPSHRRCVRSSTTSSCVMSARLFNVDGAVFVDGCVINV